MFRHSAAAMLQVLAVTSQLTKSGNTGAIWNFSKTPSKCSSRCCGEAAQPWLSAHCTRSSTLMPCYLVFGADINFCVLCRIAKLNRVMALDENEQSAMEDEGM
jgi:hypothetical protein